jgi:PIN domain nuclease of toxin-antitoxin system
VRVLLDTNVLIGLCQVGAETLTSAARRLIEDDDTAVLFSSVSVTELAVRAIIGKLEISAADVSQGVEDLRVTMIAFEPRHATRMFQLPLHHRNPFDRMLIARALSEDVPIVTTDRELKRYRGLKVLR